MKKSSTHANIGEFASLISINEGDGKEEIEDINDSSDSSGIDTLSEKNLK